MARSPFLSLLRLRHCQSAHAPQAHTVHVSSVWAYASHPLPPVSRRLRRRGATSIRDVSDVGR